MSTFDVNTDKVIGFSAKLEKLHKSAFPSAVRNTLNNAAFDMKKNIPGEASKKFVTRNKTFFRRVSAVNKAEGFNVNAMQATTGISADQELADNLGAQEFGGTVKGKKLVPHSHARVSRSKNKRVAKKYNLNKVRAYDATNTFKSHQGTRKSKFVSAVMGTVKSGRKFMLLKTNNKGTLYEVVSVSSNVRSKKVKIKLKKLYLIRNKNKHTVPSTGFLKNSAVIASNKMNEFYISNAEFQFKKHLK